MIKKENLKALKSKVSQTYTYEEAMSDIERSLISSATIHRSHATFHSSYYKWLDNLALTIQITNMLNIQHYHYTISNGIHHKTLRIYF